MGNGIQEGEVIRILLPYNSIMTQIAQLSSDLLIFCMRILPRSGWQALEFNGDVLQRASKLLKVISYTPRFFWCDRAAVTLHQTSYRRLQMFKGSDCLAQCIVRFRSAQGVLSRHAY
jgi:hypothetical protein